MRRTLALWTLALATACGGGGGGGDEQKFPDASAAQFDYTNGTDVSANASSTSGEADALASDALAVIDLDGNATPPVDAAVHLIRGPSAVAAGFADTSDPVQLPGSIPAALEASGTNPFDDPACVTATETRLTFRGCLKTTQGDTYALDGWFQRATHPRSPATIEWDVREVAVDRLSETAVARSSRHSVGSLSAYGGGVNGTMQADVSHTVTYAGGHRESAFTNYVDLSLGLDAGACVASGELELRHLWAKQPSDVVKATYPDVGVKLAWSDCGKATAVEGQ